MILHIAVIDIRGRDQEVFVEPTLLSLNDTVAQFCMSYWDGENGPQIDTDNLTDEQIIDAYFTFAGAEYDPDINYHEVEIPL